MDALLGRGGVLCGWIGDGVGEGKGFCDIMNISLSPSQRGREEKKQATKAKKRREEGFWLGF